MEFRSHLLCCVCRLDFATDLTGLAYSTGRVTFYYQSKYGLQYRKFNPKRQFLCNVTCICI